MAQLIWLGLRIFAGSYLSGVGPALAVMAWTDNWQWGYWTLVFGTPLTLGLGWCITPPQPRHPSHDLVNHLVLGALMIFYWSCIVAVLFLTEMRPMPDLMREPLLIQFCFLSAIVGSCGMLFNIWYLERRLKGLKFSLIAGPV